MIKKTIAIDELSVAFGTSGVRGLVTELTDLACYAYTQAFLRYLLSIGSWSPEKGVVMGGDLRPSTPRMMAACARACVDMGGHVINAGFVPSPAVALHGFTLSYPSLMVTGSHIPDDRNGIKFNTPTGEILKADEQGILAQTVHIPDGLFNADGMFVEEQPLPDVDVAAGANYIQRYTQSIFGSLAGKRVGVYQHSSVARQVMVEILQGLGADVVELGFASRFVPVDTEAIRPEDVVLAKQWAVEYPLDAIISTDGDADRPLVADEEGNWLRGDVLGVLTAKFLGCTHVSTPVSSNTALEKSEWFKQTQRTRIGSPFVIAGMIDMLSQPDAKVAGYEANGGFLLGSDIEQNGCVLKALPTRDAMVVALSVLSLARQTGKKISELLSLLPARYTASDRIAEFPTELSSARISSLSDLDTVAQLKALEGMFGAISGEPIHVDQTDGMRITFANDEVIHLRPSGNAPELRCYTEANSPERAKSINQQSIAVLNGWRVQH